MAQSNQGDGSNREGFLKDRTSVHSRGPSGGGKRTMPRIMWLAILVCIAGAALLFRGSNQSVPTSTGERRTVVTAPTQPDADAPRSGEVDLTGQTQDLTPEQPTGEAAATEETAPPKKIVEEKTTPPVATAAATSSSIPTSIPAVEIEAPPLLQPTPAGQYAVQTGAFGTPENADKEALRLKELGWDARVRAGNRSNGDMVYRVWICFFASRQTANDFIKQESGKIPGAIVVHR